MSLWQGVTDSTRKKISGEPGRAADLEKGLISRGPGDVGGAIERKTLVSDNMIFSNSCKNQKTSRKQIYLEAAALVLGCFWSPAILSS